MRSIEVRGAMFTVAQCLTKAVDLEQRAESGAPDDRDAYRDLARQWRRLACRALAQDQRIRRLARTPEA